MADQGGGQVPHLTLSVPNHPEYEKLVRDTARDAAKLARFHSGGRQRVAAVVGELATILMGLEEPREDVNVDLTCEVVPGGLRVTLHDDGPPFDPSRAGEASAFVHGLLENGSPDWVEFRNLGRGGKDVRIMFHHRKAAADGAPDLPDETVTDDAFVVSRTGDRLFTDAATAAIARGETTAAAEGPGLMAPAAPSRPGDPVAYGLLRPQQAASVSECIYDTYRLSYLHEDMYHPLRIAALNESGEMISAVATSPDGTVVGHIALTFPDEDRYVPEIGVAATLRDWRGHHVAHHLADLLMEEAAQRRLYGVYGEAITVHTYTQHLNVEMGFGTCAVRLAAVPADREFRGMERHGRARNSTITMFRYLGEPSRTPLDVPGQHREMIARLYGWIGAPGRLESSAPGALGDPLAGDETSMSVRLNPVSSIANLTLTGLGPDAPDLLRDELRRLRASEFRVIEAAVDMTTPGAAAAADQLEQLGFLFSGVRPGGPEREWLLYQYFNGVLVDYDVMAVDSDESRELIAYVRALDPDAA
jgi:hypothetical protein